MSFSTDVKQEICQGENHRSCCAASRLYGMLLFCKHFTARNATISSEHEFLLIYLRTLLLDFGLAESMFTVKKLKKGGTISIADATAMERLLNDFGYNGDEPSFRIHNEVFLCDECRSAFISGCFLICGNVTDPQKAYHLEFATHKMNLLADFKELLIGLEFEPRETMRGYSKILYFKHSSQIEDLLTYIGAPQSSLALMDTKIYKEIANSVNRRTNCETANIDKTVISSSRDRMAIQKIFAAKGREYLPEELREIAVLRLENPDISLAELGERLPAPLSKSGANHRLRRIRALAELIKE